MPVRLPKPSDWESKDKQELLATGTSGWNPLDRLPKLLRKYYDWAKPLEFGFFSGADVDEARSYGWEHVQTGFFDEVKDDYNRMVATPFGLIDSGGVIKWRDNFLMMMGTEFRGKQQDARNNAYEKSVAQALKGQAHAVPEDPRYDQMLEKAKELTDATSYQLHINPESEAKRGPGRQKKNRE